MILKATNIHKTYGDVEVLKGVSLAIDKGEVVSIVGASGAGKSTLLHILGTIEKADQGSILIDDEEVQMLKDKSLAQFRNQKIGFVFQFHHLLPEFNALENVCMPAFIKGISKKEAMEKGKLILEFLKLGHRLDHKPSELSGGEQQRVAVARALVNDPAIVMADEPSGNLDSDNSQELHKLFFELRDKFMQTFIVVTHNPQLADMADRKLTIKDGVIAV